MLKPNIKYKVTLTEEERKFLRKLIEKGKTAGHKIRHAQILLALDEIPENEHWTDTRVGEVYGCRPQAVGKLRKRFVEQGFEAALERKKRETPSRIKINGEAEARIIALTCSSPPEGRAREPLNKSAVPPAFAPCGAQMRLSSTDLIPIGLNQCFPGKRMTPAEILAAVWRREGRAIAYTYSEPLVHAEFLLDCMSLARRYGIANVLVTNGYACADAAEEILSLVDAANIDLKCFSPETYAQTLGGVTEGGLPGGNALETVLAFIWLARAKNVHVEITTLVVPGMNDSPAELDACADFIASLNAETGRPEIPWHLSAYHPNYLWKTPATDPGVLLSAKERAERKLKFVYAGNIPGEVNDTRCPVCGALLVRRLGYRTEPVGLVRPRDGGICFRCSACGWDTGIARLTDAPGE